MTPLPAALLIAVVVATAAAGCATPTRTVDGTAASVAAGGPVRDGALEFTVLGLTETPRVGDAADPGLSLTARGVFVVVTLSVRNTGPAAYTFIDRNQTLIDDRGRQFPVNRAANIYANPDVPSTRIGPGEALVVDIVFDVPPRTVPSAVVVRESSSSGGTTIPLS